MGLAGVRQAVVASLRSAPELADLGAKRRGRGKHIFPSSEEKNNGPSEAHNLPITPDLERCGDCPVVKPLGKFPVGVGCQGTLHFSESEV